MGVHGRVTLRVCTRKHTSGSAFGAFMSGALKHKPALYLDGRLPEYDRSRCKTAGSVTKSMGP